MLNPSFRLAIHNVSGDAFKKGMMSSATAKGKLRHGHNEICGELNWVSLQCQKLVTSDESQLVDLSRPSFQVAHNDDGGEVCVHVLLCESQLREKLLFGSLVYIL